MTADLHGLSSMATKALLATLCQRLRDRRSVTATFESAGGVDVAKDVRAGARADLVVLGEQAIIDLDADGLLEPGTARALFVSDVVAAVPADSDLEPLRTTDGLRAALLAARGIGYSTGPSGTALLTLVGELGLGEAATPKLRQAAAGTPVGAMLAAHEVDLGFQQRSELSGLDGVRILGPLPGTAAIRSTFSGAVLTRSDNPRSARSALDFFGSREVEDDIAEAGMSPARPGYRA